MFATASQSLATVGIYFGGNTAVATVLHLFHTVKKCCRLFDGGFDAFAFSSQTLTVDIETVPVVVLENKVSEITYDESRVRYKVEIIIVHGG